MTESTKTHDLKHHKPINYTHLNKYECSLLIENLKVNNGVKNWSFNSSYPTILAFFSNQEENMTNILKSLAGINYLVEGKIIIDQEDVTYNNIGWERGMVYAPSQLNYWNKLFSIQHNLGRYAMTNKAFLEEISSRNKRVKADIDNLKNTGLNLDANDFKEKIIKLIKRFINETEITRNLFIKEYEFQINHFHEEFAKTKFNFQGSELLKPILIRKFNAEEENIIANNNLLFFQSLQDRISSLENLVGECSCGCQPPKIRRKEFRLKEMIFVLEEINIFLNGEISAARKQVRTTLKSCNNHNQVFTSTLNRALTYQKIGVSRSKLEEIIDEWIDLAEVQRIKFNMKQDFVAMQLLPDEMHLLLKNIKEEVKVYHEKLLKELNMEDINAYNQKLKNLENSLIDVRDLISENMYNIFQILDLTSLMIKRYSQLTAVQRRIIIIIQQIVVVTKVVLLDNPFELLEKDDQIQLAIWLKILANKLKLIMIFSSKSQESIGLVASDICVIENEAVIQQGRVNKVTVKPLSLTLLKDMAKKHLNVFNANWQKPNVWFYQTKIATLKDITSTPIIALKANDIVFSLHKPRFTFFYKTITINGTIKDINKFSEEQSLLTFKTYNNDLFEIIVSNKNNYPIGAKGWMIISKQTIYIFDDSSKQLIGTW